MNNKETIPKDIFGEMDNELYEYVKSMMVTYDNSKDKERWVYFALVLSNALMMHYIRREKEEIAKQVEMIADEMFEEVVKEREIKKDEKIPSYIS